MKEPEREEPDAVAEDVGDLDLEPDEEEGVKGGGSGFPTFPGIVKPGLPGSGGGFGGS